MKKILIVEDDKFLVNAYKAKLLKIGYDMRVALDGEEALAILKDFTPDVILLDLIMPKKDGFVTLKNLKASEKWKEIPVVIASNLGQKDDILRGMELGAADFIVKSEVTLDDIVSKIEKLA